MFVYNRDDGIEIRLSSITQAIIGNNTFVGNGKSDVSPNYSEEELSRRTRPRTAEFSIQSGNKTLQSEIPVETPKLVGLIDVKPSIDGTNFRDLEGITAFGDYLFIGDDNSREIFTVNRFTARVESRVSTEPFPGTEITLKGPEGLSLTKMKIKGKDVLAVSDDEGGFIHYFQFNPPVIEKLLSSIEINSIAGDPEGIEFVGSKLYFLYGGNNIIMVNSSNLKKHPDFPKSISFNGFWNHIAGICKYKDNLLLTSAGYDGKIKHNGESILFSADEQINKILKVWDIAPYTNDPRGVAEIDGLVYIVDGMGHGKDVETGLLNKEGLKILIFDIEINRDIKEYYHTLPLRIR